MPADDDRREVARRLRKAIGLHKFAEVLGFDWTDESDWVWKDVSNLVADLIEPGERACYYYDAETNHCRCYDTRLVDRDAAARFKAKWMHRTPRNRVEFYQNKLQEYADRLKKEMGKV